MSRILIYTARLGYRGADRLDITLGQVEPDPVGLLLAPSRQLLAEGQRRRNVADGNEAEAAAAWAWYRACYLKEQREALKADRARLDPVLQRAAERGGEITLMCFCVITPDAPRCHRVPAAELLVAWASRRGYEAEGRGERLAAAPWQGRLL